MSPPFGTARAPETDEAAHRLGDWGFVAHADLPDSPGPAFLIVSIRDRPTLRHFDPEVVEFWRTKAGRGIRATIDRSASVPLSGAFSWGTIRIVDRFKVANAYATFGGALIADDVDGARVAVFVSSVPLLRCGGHSQIADVSAAEVAGFFARLVVAIEKRPGLERRVAEASPAELYAAFLEDAAVRFRRSPALADIHPDVGRILAAERARLRRDNPAAPEAGNELLAAAGFGPAGDPMLSRGAPRVG